MADKISTVVLKVDLECERCYKKIRKVLCKIQDKMNIKTISYDEKSSAVLLSGPFDADKLCRKLCSEAGRVIREMHVQGEKASKDKDGGGGGGGDKPKAGKSAVKDSGKVEKADKKDAGGGKPEKADKKDGGGKPEKAEKKDGGGKPEKAEKKVKFDFDDAPAAEPKPMKPMPQLPPGMSKEDLGPLLEKMMRAKQGGPEPPRGEPMGPPMMPAPAPAQGVAVPSIWPAPAGPVSGYSYNPAAYGGQPPAYYGGGGCGGGCQCGSCCKAPAAGGYYGGGGAPAYDHQGWYYGGNRQQPCYYQPQQPYHCREDPNAGCSVM